MFEPLSLRGVTFQPALFCAPLAGLTHSAFRRVTASFGACGAFWTEMLSARHLLGERLTPSPYLDRSPAEPRLIYQLMARAGDPLDRVVDRLASLAPDGIDLNLACHAPSIRHMDAGSRLFLDRPGLASTLATLRRAWPGPLFVKIRLGSERPDWRSMLADRLKLFEDAGVDAFTLHPRFFEDKFKRRTRHEEFAWAAAQTTLPMIANGDLHELPSSPALRAQLAPARAMMIGRMAIVQPWLFGALAGQPEPDLHAVWERMAAVIEEDFAPVQALRRLQLFTAYFARNFAFGHTLTTAVSNAATLPAAREQAYAFLAACPARLARPSLQGL